MYLMKFMPEHESLSSGVHPHVPRITDRGNIVLHVGILTDLRYQSPIEGVQFYLTLSGTR